MADTAEHITRATVGVDSVYYAKYLHVRGLLNTLRSRRIDALDDLESAALLLRQAGETARGICTPLHRGRTTMTWQSEILREDGRRAAMVTQTQIVLPKR